MACFAVDGDTVRCRDVGRVRLLGINAPEMPGHCRRGMMCPAGDPFASKANLQALLDGSMACEHVGYDKYGRPLCVITSRGVNLSCAQLAAEQAVYVARWDNGRRIKKACQGLPGSPTSSP